MQRVTAVGVTASVRQWRAEAEPVRQCRDTCRPNNAPSMSFPALGIAVGAMGVHAISPGMVVEDTVMHGDRGSIMGAADERQRACCDN